MENGALLQVDDLRTWFELRRFGFIHVGSVKAVDGVSFDLEACEAVAIVGESGCGKSTLAKTILGLTPPTSGQISFGGDVIDAKTPPAVMRSYRAQVGYIQQDPYGALPPFMTLEQILNEPMLVNGIKNPKERQERIHKVLSELKLTPAEDFLSKFPHMLSGGQQQRAVIARSQILSPRLIVADEPVSMLDASVRVEILQLLRRLQEAHNLGVIYITHDLSTVRFFSERILVMYAAKLVEQAPVQELLDHPLHPYTQALLEAISDPDARNVATFKAVPPGEPPSLLHPPEGCRFHPRCSRKMAGLCDREMPPEITVSEGHKVLCWLYDKRGGDKQ